MNVQKGPYPNEIQWIKNAFTKGLIGYRVDFRNTYRPPVFLQLFYIAGENAHYTSCLRRQVKKEKDIIIYSAPWVKKKLDFLVG